MPGGRSDPARREGAGFPSQRGRFSAPGLPRLFFSLLQEEARAYET